MTPTISRVLALIFVVGSAFALGSCDPAYGPVIANGYRAPVTLHAMFSDQRAFDGVLPSGSDFWQHIEGR